MNENVVYLKLLCYGLFPERLEGILTSERFGEWIIQNRSKLTIPARYRFSLLSYNATRNNNSPRQMGIIHPIGFVRLCEKIRENWNKIENNFNGASCKEKSMVVPKLNNKNKRLVSMTSYDKNPDEEQMHLDKQFGKKYFVHADVSSCFQSIYTHCISWALVGKNTSKKNIGKDYWYNELDWACQNIQDGETKGIPIGPDTSGILSEVILFQIDKKLKKYSYLRFIDDYKCFCATKEEAERFIRDLSQFLGEYRLYLNTKKTKILPLPRALNDDWVRKLKQQINWKEISYSTKSSVVGFLDLSNELFGKNPDESPIRYAVQVLRKKKYIDYRTYKLVLRYLLNLCFLFPYITDLCDDFISVGIKTFPEKETETKETLTIALDLILQEHTKYRRSDVITWTLFLAIKYKLNFGNFEKISSAILKTKDCIPSLMCFLYRKINNMNVASFVNLIKTVPESEWWLYVYEISRIEKKCLVNTEMEKMRKAEITFLSKEINSNLLP